MTYKIKNKGKINPQYFRNKTLKKMETLAEEDYSNSSDMGGYREGHDKAIYEGVKFLVKRAK